MKFYLPLKLIFPVLGIFCLSTLGFGSSFNKSLFSPTLLLENSTLEVNCDISITDVVVSNESCSPGNDGTLTITATCVSCTNGNADIVYSINGGPFQPSNVFSGLTAGVYDIIIQDTGDPSCTSEISASVFNSPTITVDDQFTTGEDQIVSMTVLANDQNTCGADRSLLIVSGASQGNAVLGTNNTIDYTPDTNTSGCDQISYAFVDPPSPTTANDDITSTSLNTSVVIAVLNNDTDPQLDPLTPSLIASSEVNGAVVLNGNNTFTFTPNSGFSGLGQFEYEINDGNGNIDQATVKINVQAGEPGKLHYIPEKWNSTNHTIATSQLWLSTEGPNNATVTVSTLSGYSETFIVTPTTTTQKTLFNKLGYNPATDIAELDTIGNRNSFNSIGTRALKIVSDEPVNAQIVQQGSNGQSFLNSKSVDGLGTKFFVGQQGKFMANGSNDLGGYETMSNPGEFNARSTISVVAIEDNTSVTFTTPPGSTWDWDGTTSSTVTVILDEGESYLVSTDDIDENMTGAKVESDKPISVSCGSFGVQFDPATDNGWDHIVPVERVGTDYFIVSTSGTSDPDEAYIVATEDNTVVSIDGTQVATLNEGEYYNHDIDNLSVSSNTVFIINTSKPSYVYHCTGKSSGEVGLAIIAPIDVSGRGEFRFKTPFLDNGSSTVSMVLLTATSAISSVELKRLDNNNLINISNWIQVPTKPELSYALLELNDDVEFLLESDAFAQIFMRSAGNQGGGVAYIAGFSSSTFISTEDNLVVAQGIPVTFDPTANDTDPNGNPVTLENFTQPTNGIVTQGVGNELTYTPLVGYTGSDNFSYTAGNGEGFFTTATVSLEVQSLSIGTVDIDINPIADDPGITANDVSGNTGDNVTLDITIGALVDTDGSESIDNVVISGVPGTATLSAGSHDGSGNWTMTLSESQTVTASGTSGGTFNLTATVNITDETTDCASSTQSDSDGFSDAFTLSLTQTCNISINSVTPTDETCDGGNDGTLTIAATCVSCTNGASDIRYSIDGTNFFDNGGVFSGLADGMYNITVRDVNDEPCSTTSTGHIIAAGPGACCDINITSVTPTDEGCPGAADGSITITATCTSCINGAADIRYSIDGTNFLDNGGVFNDLGDATYTVTVRDVNDIGCTDMNSVDGVVGAGTDTEAPVPDNVVGGAAYTELYKALATDGANFDEMGRSVAIFGDYAMVGSYKNNNGNGSNSGGVYVYHFDGSVWSYSEKLVPADNQADDNFGISIAMDGDYAVIGASGDDDAGNAAGAAYVYKRVGTTWMEEDKVTSSNASSIGLFGTSVSISGDVIVVGAYNNNSSGTTFGGSATVYRRTGASWNEESVLVSSDVEPGDQLGWSVAVDGDYIIVGAVQEGSFAYAGSAYIFFWNGSTWTETQKLLASDVGPQDRFGYSVSIDGDYIAVGALKHTEEGTATSNGAAYIFKRTGAVWSEEVKLLASDLESDAEFGFSLVLVGDILAVGARKSNTGGVKDGAAYVFERTGTSWNEVNQVLPNNTGVDMFFGSSIDFHQSRLICGAIGDDEVGFNRGSATIFNETATSLVDITAECSVTPPVATAIDNCGGSINGATSTSFPITTEGETTLVWSFTDASGNTSTVDQLVTITVPDINIQGNGMDISSGDDSPDVADDTDFGTITDVQTATRTYSIQNLGSGDLDFTGNPIVSVSGSTDFSVQTQPNSSSIVSGGSDLTFVVLYDPSDVGTDDAVITVASDDCDTGSYTFDITAEAIISCAISITSVTPMDETCPDESDGSITIVATCTSCTNGAADIRYSIDGINFLDNGGVFNDLGDATYT
ncbi:MAG: Ig-like domain-containing protein, partial [Saprospiraceae bacterium]|nr:Ig-like domain-containing protein [Saprospiraceae bacterium]